MYILQQEKEERIRREQEEQYLEILRIPISVATDFDRVFGWGSHHFFAIA